MRKSSEAQQKAITKELETLKDTCETTQKENEEAVENNKDDKETNGKNRADATDAMAKAKAKLVDHQTILAEADVFVKDLTASCHARATDWDKRSVARNGEVEALNTALEVLNPGGDGAGGAVGA